MRIPPPEVEGNEVLVEDVQTVTVVDLRRNILQTGAGQYLLGMS
jgi:hypothetical protein